MNTIKDKFSTSEIMNNVSNSAYWEAIDYLAGTYIKKLMKCSDAKINVCDTCYTEEILENMNDKERKAVIDKEIAKLGREITEFAVNLLEERYGANFPMSPITKLMRNGNM